MRVALDTNILVYAESTGPNVREDAARRLVARLPAERIVVPAQVLGELFNVLTRKAKLSAADSATLVARWMASYDVIPTTSDVLGDAFALVKGHKLGTWDAVVLAAAARAGCRYLLSEDMQDGFSWHGVTIVNPFGAVPLPGPLASLLADPR